MIYCQVIGTVVMTVKHPAYEGEKLMACRPIDENGKAQGAVILAIDRAQAGEGDRVLVMREGNGIRQIIGREKGVPVDEAVKMEWPVRSMIVAIVDHAEVPPSAAPTMSGE